MYPTAMTRVLNIFCVVLFMINRCMSGRNNVVCTQPTKTGSGIPKPKLPSQYQMQIECNFLDTKQTTTISENYDYYGNRGQITQRQNGNVASIFFNYFSNEFLEVRTDLGTCYAQNLSTTDNKFVFGYAPGKKVQGHIFSASGAMHFTESSSTEVYVGKGVVRGIQVDMWQSCPYWPDMDATMNVTWSFSDRNEWTTALGLQAVPVSAHVIGISRNRNFEHLYNFHDFKYTVQNSSFEIPDGIVCPKRRNEKKIPPLSNTFLMTGEKINVSVTYIHEKYDTNQRIASYDFQPTADMSNEYGLNRMTEINDFNTGVAYIIDEWMKNCTVTTIDHGSFLYKTVPVANIKEVRMLKTKEFFMLNDMIDRYTYIGRRTYRDIPCDVWTGIHHVNRRGSYNTTVEWYFLASDWSTWSDALQTIHGVGVPVAVTFWDAAPVPLPTGRFINDYTFNFFGFDKSDANILNYDISPCYTFDNRRKFHVAIDGKYEQFLNDNIELFKYSFVTTIVNLCIISPLRIANVKVDLDTDVHVVFEMLDEAPLAGDNPSIQSSLTRTANIFIESVQSGNFKIVWYKKFVLPYSQAPNITVQKDSLREYDYEKKQFGHVGTTGYGPGPMAGVAFAMVIIGGTMGAGTSFFCFNK